jgi:hypothetical protein
MKKMTWMLLVIGGLVLTALPASAAPFLLAQHGHGGGHGGRGGTVIIGGGWGWGWGWGGWGWGYPGYGYAYGYDPAYGYGRPAWARVKTDVSPEEARLYLDGKLIGTADDFDGWPDYLYLRRGHYRLEFRLTGYEPVTIEVDARPGATIKVDNHLKKIAGAPRGSYDEPTVHPVLRYWGKKKDSVVAIEPGSRDGVYGRDERSRGDAEDDDAYSPEPDRPLPPRDREPARDSDWREDRRPSDATVAAPRGVSTRSRLQLRIEPPDAAVYVDDRFVGTAEEVNSLGRGVAVSPGKHTVTVSRPGFKDRSANVDVSAGGTEKVEISLSR